mmetsp:Transcript_30931/g.49646  ORF Transcript_30931/g.49646 Transcript_30931/m.49646 type:complete len:430 (+) Transcript_30931:120-1409(+)
MNHKVFLLLLIVSLLTFVANASSSGSASYSLSGSGSGSGSSDSGDSDHEYPTTTEEPEEPEEPYPDRVPRPGKHYDTTSTTEEPEEDTSTTEKSSSDSDSSSGSSSASSGESSDSDTSSSASSGHSSGYSGGSSSGSGDSSGSSGSSSGESSGESSGSSGSSSESSEPCDHCEEDTTTTEEPDDETTTTVTPAPYDCGDSNQECCSAGSDGCHNDGETCILSSFGGTSYCVSPSERPAFSLRCGSIGQTCCIGTYDERSCVQSDGQSEVEVACAGHLCTARSSDSSELECGGEDEPCCVLKDSSSQCDGSLSCERSSSDRFLCVADGEEAAVAQGRPNEENGDEYELQPDDKALSNDMDKLLLAGSCVAVLVVVMAIVGVAYCGYSKNRKSSGHRAVVTIDDDMDEDTVDHAVIDGHDDETEMIQVHQC